MEDILMVRFNGTSFWMLGVPFTGLSPQFVDVRGSVCSFLFWGTVAIAAIIVAFFAQASGVLHPATFLTRCSHDLLIVPKY